MYLQRYFISSLDVLPDITDLNLEKTIFVVEEVNVLMLRLLHRESNLVIKNFHIFVNTMYSIQTLEYMQLEISVVKLKQLMPYAKISFLNSIAVFFIYSLEIL